MWLLAMASGAAVFILTPDVWTLALAAGIVLVPLAGMAGAFAARKAVAVEVILPRGAEKGRDAVIAFWGTNGAWLPLPRVEFRFVMTNGLTGETRRETVRLSLPGRGTGETALTLHSGQCGLFRIQAGVRPAGNMSLYGGGRQALGADGAAGAVCHGAAAAHAGQRQRGQRPLRPGSGGV